MWVGGRSAAEAEAAQPLISVRIAELGSVVPSLVLPFLTKWFLSLSFADSKAAPAGATEETGGRCKPTSADCLYPPGCLH